MAGIRSWHLEPAYLDFLAAAVAASWPTCRPATTVLFTAHSLPERILATGDPYPEQLRATAAAVAERAGLAASTWDVAWQSAGRTPEPWLGPDVLDGHRRAWPTAATWTACWCAPAGSSPTTSRSCTTSTSRPGAGPSDEGLAFARTACVNDDREVMAALAGLVVDRVAAPR